MNSVFFAILFLCILHLVDGKCSDTEVCELRQWYPWNCTDCCKLNAAPFSAQRPRAICCPRTENTLDKCLRACNRSIDEVQQTDSCVAHCTCPNGFHFATTTSTSTSTSTPTPTPNPSTSSTAFQSSRSVIKTISATPPQSSNGHLSSLRSSESTSTASLISSGTGVTVALGTTRSSGSQLLSGLLSTEPTSNTSSLRVGHSIPTTLGIFQGWSSTAGGTAPNGTQVKRPGHRETSDMGFENMCGVGFSLFLFFVGVSVGLLASVILSCLCKKKGRKIGLNQTNSMRSQPQKRKMDQNDAYKRGNRTTTIDVNAMDF